jgi:nicotinamide mononucleotide transporter
MRQHLWCWYAAFASTSIYAFLFWDVNLLMESALQIYYLAMALYGWQQWRKKDSIENNTVSLAISTWTTKQHGLAIAATLVLSYLSGQLLADNTDAARPFIDSFTTWGAVLTTYMVTKKVLENWIYWFVIDGICIFLYLDRGLHPTAALFLAYEIIVIFGYLKWRAEWREQNPELRNARSEAL